MTSDLITEILDDVSRWEEPLEEIVPVNYGEFFCRGDWLWILKAISQKLPQTMIVLPTNGSLINDEVIKELADIKTIKIINFSVNAFFEETYKSFTGLNPKNLDNIKETMQKLKVIRPDIFLVASMVFDPMYQTDLERDNFCEYWKQYAFPQIIAAASARRPEKKACISNITPCRSIFSDIVIGYDRKLSSCCFDAGMILDLGSYTGDLKKDWHNTKLTELRNIHNEHRRQEIDLCKECSFS